MLYFMVRSTAGLKNSTVRSVRSCAAATVARAASTNAIGHDSHELRSLACCPPGVVAAARPVDRRPRRASTSPQTPGWPRAGSHATPKRCASGAGSLRRRTAQTSSQARLGGNRSRRRRLSGWRLSPDRTEPLPHLAAAGGGAVCLHVAATRRIPNAIRPLPIRLDRGPRRLPRGGARRPRGARGGHPERGVAELRRRPGPHAVLAPRRDRRRQLQRPGGRLDVEHRQLRAESGVPPAVDAADGRRHPVHDGRQPAGGGRTRCGHRGDPLVPPLRRGRAGRGGAAAAVGPGADLAGRRRGREDLLRHARLPPDRPQRRHRQAAGRLRQRRHRRPEAEPRPGHRPGHRRDRPALGAGRGQRHHRHRGGAPAGRRAPLDEQRQGVHPRLRRRHRRAQVDLPHHSARRRVRQRHLGRRLVALHGQRRRVGPR